MGALDKVLCNSEAILEVHCMKHVYIPQYSKLVLVSIVPHRPTFTKLYH